MKLKLHVFGKKVFNFTPDYCPILLNSDPWIVQPSEYYDEIEISALKKIFQIKKARRIWPLILITK